MPTTFSGSLQSKKKSELQDIAIALDIADSGTREDLQSRIKLHLSQNEAELSEDPRFVGLLTGRGRKRSAQPQMLTTIKEDVRSVTSEETFQLKSSSPTRTRSVALFASPPPNNDSLARVITEIEPEDVPLPLTPAASVVMKAASAVKQDATSLLEKAREQEQTMLMEGRKRLIKQKKIMSHWVNIYAFTVLAELVPLIYTSWPTRIKSHDGNIWMTFLLQLVALFRLHGPLFGYWSIPTLVLPLLCGMFISFNTPQQDFDPVTVAIIRVACAFASNWSIHPTALSPLWRRLNASVHVAFAFAEAIGIRNPAFVEELDT